MTYENGGQLDRALKKAVRDRGGDPGDGYRQALRDRFLCRVFSDPDGRFILKGGSGLLARIPDGRATRDIDFATASQESSEDALAALVELAGRDMGDFLAFKLDKWSESLDDNGYSRLLKLRELRGRRGEGPHPHRPVAGLRHHTARRSHRPREQGSRRGARVMRLPRLSASRSAGRQTVRHNGDAAERLAIVEDEGPRRRRLLRNERHPCPQGPRPRDRMRVPQARHGRAVALRGAGCLGRELRGVRQEERPPWRACLFRGGNVACLRVLRSRPRWVPRARKRLLEFRFPVLEAKRAGRNKGKVGSHHAAWAHGNDRRRQTGRHTSRHRRPLRGHVPHRHPVRGAERSRLCGAYRQCRPAIRPHGGGATCILDNLCPTAREVVNHSFPHH